MSTESISHRPPGNSDAESWDETTDTVDPPGGSRAAAIAAAAAAALVGGLVWAGVVISTRLDIGFLALGIGAATGFAVARIAGRNVRTGDRLLAGVLATGGIVVGKYVIFVHDVREALGSLLGAHGAAVGYLDTRQMSVFVHNIRHIVHPIYALWIALAFYAAYRTAAGQSLRPRKRNSSSRSFRLSR